MIEIILINVQVKNPINKIISSRLPIGTINNN
jgi:hypothetical protein